jgi:hypothetical protein
VVKSGSYAPAWPFQPWVSVRDFGYPALLIPVFAHYYSKVFLICFMSGRHVLYELYFLSSQALDWACYFMRLIKSSPRPWNLTNLRLERVHFSSCDLQARLLDWLVILLKPALPIHFIWTSRLSRELYSTLAFLKHYPQTIRHSALSLRLTGLP